MGQGSEWVVYEQDVQVLRELASRQVELAAEPVMSERRALWLRHAALEGERPMILAETGGVLDELIPPGSLRCRANWARELERRLRELVFRCEQVRDDWVAEPWLNVPWFIDLGGFGVDVLLERADNDGRLGSYRWDPPVKDLDRDLERLRMRSPRVDRARTLAFVELLNGLLGDILPVRVRGAYWWTTGLTWTAINLIGLQPLMMAMVDNPQGLHRLMAFLRDDMLHVLDWLEREGLLSLNNENDYVGSGSIGYTDELPRDGSAESGAVRVSDLWGLSESQETVGVSPAMFEEYVFQYQEPIIRRFGLSYYGCCEPLHGRVEIIKRLPNLRRVSVSPWCDEQVMAEALGGDYIYCRKPKPTLISTPQFDEEMIRTDLRHTLQVASGCPLELVMKDVHTLSDQPWRLGRWVALAREVCAEFGYG